MEILDMKNIFEMKTATNTINTMAMNEWISWKIRMNTLSGKKIGKKKDKETENVKEGRLGVSVC